MLVIWVVLVIWVAEQFLKMHDTDVGDLGGRRVFENAQWRNVNNNGDLDVLVIWVAEEVGPPTESS